MNSAFIKGQLAVVQAKEARLRAARAEIEAAIFRGQGQTPLRGVWRTVSKSTYPASSLQRGLESFADRKSRL